jgi:hypothetical protein
MSELVKQEEEVVVELTKSIAEQKMLVWQQPEHRKDRHRSMIQVFRLHSEEFWDQHLLVV